MSESNELNLIYLILQIVGIIAFFICCLTCLYYRGMNEKKKRIHDEKMYPKDLTSRVNSLEKKIQKMENKSFVAVV
jgi:hypothetical protein